MKTITRILIAIEICLLAFLSLGYILNQQSSDVSESSTFYINSNQPYSYLIYNDGTTTFAKNQSNGKVDYTGNSLNDISTVFTLSNKSIFIKNTDNVYTITNTISITKDKTKVHSDLAMININANGKKAFEITGNDVEISGLRISGVYLGDLYPLVANSIGIYVAGTVNSPVKGSYIHDNIISNFSYAGIFGQYMNNSRIERNTIYNISYSAITVTLSNHSKINENNITYINSTYPNSYGIIASAGGLGDDFEDVEIASNIITNILTWECIDTHAGRAVNIHHNYIKTCGTDGIHLTPVSDTSPSYVNINHNVIEITNVGSATHGGISVGGRGDYVNDSDSGNALIISDNTINVLDDARMNGIAVSGFYGSNIHDNVIHKANNGISVSGLLAASREINIHDNVIYDPFSTGSTAINVADTNISINTGKIHDNIIGIRNTSINWLVGIYFPNNYSVFEVYNNKISNSTNPILCGVNCTQNQNTNTSSYNFGVFPATSTIRPSAYTANNHFTNSSHAPPNDCVSTAAGTSNWVYRINGSAGC